MSVHVPGLPIAVRLKVLIVVLGAGGADVGQQVQDGVLGTPGHAASAVNAVPLDQKGQNLGPFRYIYTVHNEQYA